MPIQDITASEFDMSKSMFWNCGAIDVPNPTNVVSAQSGLIFFTDTPTSWGSNFQFPGGTPGTYTAGDVLPFVATGVSTIKLGNPTVGIA